MGKRYSLVLFVFVFVFCGQAGASGKYGVPTQPPNPTKQPEAVAQPTTTTNTEVASKASDTNTSEDLSHIQKAENKDASSGPWTTKKGKSCGIGLNDLNYVGYKFKGPAICVDANNDREALHACSGTNYSKVINPANRQYGQGDAKRDSNDIGYYYCVKPIHENDKQHICINLLQKIPVNDSYMFSWESAADGSSDGDCFCAPRGSGDPGGKLSCVENPPKNQCGNLKPAPRDPETYGPTIQQCICDGADKKYVNWDKQDQCGALAEKNEQEVESAATPDQDLKNCVDTHVKLSEECLRSSEEAETACDPEQRSNNSDVATALAKADRALVGSKAGSGAQELCFGASLALNTTGAAIKSIGDSCSTNLTSCTNKCGKDKYDEFYNKCQSYLTKVSQSTCKNGQDCDPVDEANQAKFVASKKYFYDNSKEIQKNYTDGADVCGTDVKKGESKISEMLNAVGKALSASVQCACKLSSGEKNCASIPTVADCNINPSSPGCAVYGAINVCSPGAGYNAKLCDCQINPKSAGCPGGGASGGLSNFTSGAGFKNNAGASDGGVSLFAGNLKPSSGDIDLSSGNGEGEGSLLQLGGGGNGPPSSGGGVGGGLAPPGGGGEAPAEEMEAAPEEKGLGGLFNQAKSFISNALGLKKKQDSGNGNMKSRKNENGLDANRFRPRRGLASKSGFGTKNQDIWIMMNRCVNAETCKNNNNSFLDQALRHK